MLSNLLTIYSQDDPPANDDLSPIFDENWALKQDKGEEIVWSEKISELTFGINGKKKWELQGVDVIITNQRIVYLCHKYKKGSRWWGMGYGAIFALLAMIISAIWAAVQRQGKAAVGQVRYQWPQTVMQETCKNDGFSDNENLLNILVSNEAKQAMVLNFGMSKQACDEATNALLHNLALFRVNRDFTTTKFPNEDPKRIEETKSKMVDRLTTKSKSEETKTKTHDYYELSKTSLPIPRLE